MRRAGVEILAHWRESGAWWSGEHPQEIVQWRDSRGVRREKIRALPARLPTDDKPVWHEDLSVEITLRPRKTRDEKVAIANGKYQEGVRPRVEHRRGYAPLHLASGYSFGRSVLLAREIPRLLAYNGIGAACLADRFALTGAVEFVRESRECGVKALVGCTLEMAEGGDIVLIARDKEGYQSLSRLVTECHLSEPRLFALCDRNRLQKHSRGLLCLTGGDTGRLDRLLLRGEFELAEEWLDFLCGIYGSSQVFVEIERSWLPWGLTLERRLSELAERKGVRCVAGGVVTHSRPEDFPAQDTALCAETLCMVEDVIGRKPSRFPTQPQVEPRPERSLNSERFLMTLSEASERFADSPELLDETLRLVERCDDDVLPARTRLPSLFDDAAAVLRHATYAGASLYHKSISGKLRRRLDHELERIERLHFSDHFLTIWDACRWASDQKIHFSGRGSMVDSAVAYCLGLSRIDAFRHNLHFDRFLPEDGSKRPDIDIDFEAKRREDIRQYLVKKYGADRVATVAAIGAYNTRGIIREVGKALGLSNQAIAYLAKRIHGGVVPDQLENALDKRPELRDSSIDRERLRWLFRLAKMLADVPRNMRAHSSGVVISDQPIADTVPVQWAGPCQEGEHDGALRSEDENLRIIQWDKRSAKHYFDKFDILCLRGQDVLSGTEERVRTVDLDFNVQAVPGESEECMRAMRSGELIGVPQSASPAMRQAHMRLRTENLHDASLVQAGIRPGVGGAVKLNELIARRRGLKPFSFEHPDFESVLGQTYGIVVFQEQIDQLLQVFAGYGSGEAEDIRDEIHKRRREDYGQVIKDEVISRVVKNGYSSDVAEKVFEYVAGFKGYGFAQGHALAFAEISLRSIYCQQNFPAEYFASLLDAQPAGYYGPCTLVNEARSRGVKILPVDVCKSTDRHTVESVASEMEPYVVVPHAGIRLSLQCVSGLSKETRKKTCSESSIPFASFHDYVRRVRPNRDELERLILCGAFDTLCSNRRALLWAVPQALEWSRSLNDGLFDCIDDSLSSVEPTIDLSVHDFSDAEKAIRERAILGLDVESHIVSFERNRIQNKGGITCDQARRMKPGQKAIVVGNPIRLRFPPTPSGRRVVFFDLEDETGLLNVTCFDRTYQRDGHAVVTSPYVTLIGMSQWRDGHTAFLAQRAFPYDPHISKIVDLTEPIPVTTADFLVG